MSNQENEKPIVNRIDVDETTAEPVIVEVPENEIPDTTAQKDDVEIKEADFFKEKKSFKSIGKQMMMSNIVPNVSSDEKNVSKRQKIFSLIVKIVFVLFVVGVLAYTFYNDFFARGEKFPSLKELGDIFSQGWVYLLLAFVSLFMCYLTKALKLSVICKPLTGKFHFKTCFETGIIGHYYNSVTPLAVGGQPFEIYHLSKHGVHGGTAAALPIATYVLNQFAFVITGFIFLLMFKFNTLQLSPTLAGAFPTTFTVMAIIGLALCMMMPLLVIVFSLMPRVGASLVKFVMFLGGKLRIVKDPKKATYKTTKNVINNAKCLKTIFTKPIPAILCFLLSFLEVFSLASIAYFSLKTFGFGSTTPGLLPENNVGLEWLQIVQLVVMLNCAISFIPTPGNAGAADLSFYLLFALGLAGGLAFPAMVVWRGLAFYSFIIIGFIFSAIRKRVDKKHAVHLDDIEQ